MHSSQNEQDTRYYGEFAKLMLFEPANQQECYDMTREAFELSERLEIPVMLQARDPPGAQPGQRDPATIPAKVDRKIRLVERTQDWTLLPVNARRRFRRLLDSPDGS